MGAPESLKPNDLRTSAKFTPRRLESSFNVHSAPKAKEVPGAPIQGRPGRPGPLRLVSMR